MRKMPLFCASSFHCKLTPSDWLSSVLSFLALCDVLEEDEAQDEVFWFAGLFVGRFWYAKYSNNLPRCSLRCKSHETLAVRKSFRPLLSRPFESNST